MNDRIPYVFVETSKKNALMGDRIEHVDHVRKALLLQGGGCGSDKATVHVDTKLYIQNQIQKPCLQLLGIALEQIPEYRTSPVLTGPDALHALVKAKAGNRRKARERLDALREKEVERLLFVPVLAHDAFKARDARCSGQNMITSYFARK